MLFTTLSTAVLLAASVNALPWPVPQAATYTPARDLSRLAPLFPQSALPAPNEELKYVLLGIGTQNYTCTTGDENAAPGTTGAVATLYDIGSALNKDPIAKWKIPNISGLALALSAEPRTLALSLKLQGYGNMVGHHFFSNIAGVNTPTFSLDNVPTHPVARVSKINEIDAPKSACPGDNGLGAVKWLYLKDTKSYSQGGIDTVYRVETAGGKQPATCKGMKASFEVKYAAQYWIYGPKQ